VPRRPRAVVAALELVHAGHSREKTCPIVAQGVPIIADDAKVEYNLDTGVINFEIVRREAKQCP